MTLIHENMSLFIYASIGVVCWVIGAFAIGMLGDLREEDEVGSAYLALIFGCAFWPLSLLIMAVILMAVGPHMLGTMLRKRR